ncbi:hypothetical protein [Actinokineospora sp.]|uniref:hypothetical protein n=1 Tax=Actinokineospora sp. TaxID=1872133 RepID=UPI003D6C0CF6
MTEPNRTTGQTEVKPRIAEKAQHLRTRLGETAHETKDRLDDRAHHVKDRVDHLTEHTTQLARIARHNPTPPAVVALATALVARLVRRRIAAH